MHSIAQSMDRYLLSKHLNYDLRLKMLVPNIQVINQQFNKANGFSLVCLVHLIPSNSLLKVNPLNTQEMFVPCKLQELTN